MMEAMARQQRRNLIPEQLDFSTVIARYQYELIFNSNTIEFFLEFKKTDSVNIHLFFYLLYVGK